MEEEKPKKGYRWIRNLGIIIIIGNIIVYLLIILGDTKGKKLQYDATHAIYYSEEYFDPSFIREIGDVFAQIKFFSPDNALDVQIFRSPELGDTVVVGYVVDENKLTPEVEQAFKDITQTILPLLRTHTKIEFKDENLNTLNQLLLE